MSVLPHLILALLCSAIRIGTGKIANTPLGVFGYPDCIRMHPEKQMEPAFAETDLLCLQNPAPTERIRIACVGDSITAGFRATSSFHTYPAQLQSLLDSNYPGRASVTNLGATGTTMQKNTAYSYWNTAQLKALEKNKWDMIVIMFGTNDCLRSLRNCYDGSRLNNCAFVRDYKEFISLAGTLGRGRGMPPPKVYVMIPPPSMFGDAETNVQTCVNTDLPQIVSLLSILPSSPTQGLIDVYKHMGGVPDWKTRFPETCTLNSAEPACQWFCNAVTCDQIHPNDYGYHHLAKFVMESIQRVTTTPAIPLTTATPVPATALTTNPPTISTSFADPRGYFLRSSTTLAIPTPSPSPATRPTPTPAETLFPTLTPSPEASPTPTPSALVIPSPTPATPTPTASPTSVAAPTPIQKAVAFTASKL